MICGAVLSELESDDNFDLGARSDAYRRGCEPGPDFTVGWPFVCRLEFPEARWLCSSRSRSLSDRGKKSGS